MIYPGYDLLADNEKKKVQFFKERKVAYFLASVLAGVYVGLCMITILVMAGALDHFAGIKILQGVSFAAALSLVVFAGAELFTGNVFVMFAGVMWKEIKVRDGIALCVLCYFGNLAGSILIASLFWGTGYLQGKVLAQAAYAIIAKTDPLFIELLIRGVLCNVLVCLAVWCAYRMKSESGKLIMIFWCIYLFVVCGFEHSIANMTLFSMGRLAGGEDIASFGLMLYNLAATTIGNISGGILLSLSYWVIGMQINVI
jgi:nitrite transporter NirC